jgi:hypothetical protein
MTDIIYQADFKTDEAGNIPGFKNKAGQQKTLVTLEINPLTGRMVGMTGGGSGLLPVPFVLAQAAMPVIFAPNGTVAANGDITLGTALPTTYAAAWVRLPAGAVVGGLAGLYFATFSSATVGSIKTTFVDAATAFTPYIPASPVAAVGSNAAYTQTTAADVTLANITVPGGAMGPNGALRSEFFTSQNSTAGGKLPKTFFSGVQIFNAGVASSLSAKGSTRVRNRGSLSAQISTQLNTFGGDGVTTGNNFVFTSINTAVDQPLTFTGNIAVATDYIVLECFTVEVLPA